MEFRTFRALSKSVGIDYYLFIYSSAAGGGGCSRRAFCSCSCQMPIVALSEMASSRVISSSSLPDKSKSFIFSFIISTKMI